MSSLIGPGILVVWSNNSRGSGEEGGPGAECRALPLKLFIPKHVLQRDPGVRGAAGVPGKRKRRPRFISLLFHAMLALWGHAETRRR